MARDSPSNKRSKLDSLYRESYVLIIYVILRSYIFSYVVVMEMIIVKFVIKDGLLQGVIY